ncbi:MAG: 50S ribosomal protein L29 [Chloroflexota bacterium]|nr:MAG: 50S ribosomal protein L29 [Chloroflexota bacterium]
MDVRALRNMTTEQLLDELEDLREAMFKQRLQLSSGQLEDTNALRYTRRDIARVKTVLRERQLAAQVAGEESKSNG